MVKALVAGTLLLCCVALAGCSRTIGPPALPPGPASGEFAMAGPGAAGGYRVLYSFATSYGETPDASLLYSGGTLYGTTELGGAYDEGSVFSLSTTGTEHLLYSFQGGYPRASLIDVKGTLYGTTAGSGSPCACGTVFKFIPGGALRTVYTFKGGEDGAVPFANLLDDGGTLYGTTTQGGANNGTVFSVSANGKERVLYAFDLVKHPGDGSEPDAGVIEANGMLYGTTVSGGSNGYGSIFRVTKAGKEQVLYSFKAGNDGAAPYAGLVQVNGAFYGTTASGGGSGCGGFGCGTVFKLSSAGAERAIYRFNGGKDGIAPHASLFAVSGALYGTTTVGGGTGCGGGGCGTVFKVTTSGVERVLHVFAGGKDGSNPSASLIAVKGTLYGTTAAGGTYNSGTAFTLKP